MTTQDIILLIDRIRLITRLCNGEYRGGERYYFTRLELLDTVSRLSYKGGLVDYLEAKGYTMTIEELHEALCGFLDSSTEQPSQDTPRRLYLADNAREWITEYLADGGTADELRQGVFNAMGEIIELCSEWVEWIEKYFPSRDGAQLPGDPARILPVTPRPGMEPGTREASTPSRIAATNEIKSCLLVSTDNQDKLLKKLHQLIDGNKGKRVALVVRLCVDLGLMSKPTFGVLAKEFPKIGNKAGYNRYYKSFQEPIYCKDFEAEINGIKQHLTPFKNQI